MKILCAPETFKFPKRADGLQVVLYGQPGNPRRGAAGEAIKRELRREGLMPAPRAWDFLSLSLAVMAADAAGHRARSPDGWTREFDIQVAVIDPRFWNGQAEKISQALSFLTTDVWKISFVAGGAQPIPPRSTRTPTEKAVVLLSGGLDSFIGAIDLVASGAKPIAVSHLVRGDGERQRDYAAELELRHIQLNHNTVVPDGEMPPSQRARSMSFIAYGVLVATALKNYVSGKTIPLYMCENGFIAINPPLTITRLGSLSTRTAHPVFIKSLQSVLDDAGLRVKITNPYEFVTKGEMLVGAKSKDLVERFACDTTSCGRLRVYNNQHCGRCIPCLIRRAAFLRAGIGDTTVYKFPDLSSADAEAFEDVRAAAMAVAKMKAKGIGSIVDAALSASVIGATEPYLRVVERGLIELGVFLQSHGVE